MPKIELNNSLTRKKEPFEPLVPRKVGLYTCGPTVYDYAHLGNMRAYITWDILKRFLKSQGYEVNHIMNVTDVGHLTTDADTGDDKMEVAIKREHLSAKQIAEKYFTAFKSDLEMLNIEDPTKFVKATDHIEEQIDLAKALDAKGYLYRISDGMYFDTSKFQSYGALGVKEKIKILPGARVDMTPEKRNDTDFAVWKFSPPADEGKRAMEWESPWGVGFPGWHLECSAMAMKYLGETVDIHTGGIDHLTVHHPNEIAQSEAVTGKPFVRYWLHNNFLLHKDKKFSKSDGTFVRLKDISTGGVSPLAYRYFALQTHYRKELCYSWESLQAANTGLNNLYKEISFYTESQGRSTHHEEKFFEALADDINTPKALSQVHKLVGSKESSGAKLNSLFTMDAVLGLGLKEEWERRHNIPEEVIALMKQREQARINKDYKLSDAIRLQIEDLGIDIKDTSEGQSAAMKE